MFKMRWMAALVIVGAMGGWFGAFAADDAGKSAPARKARKAKREQVPHPNRKPKMIDLRRYAKFQQPSEVRIKLIKAIHSVLATRPDANYMDVSKDAAVQAICKENGIEAFGGPMLGSVRSDGAAVWVRTVRPAKVEVRVKIGDGEKVVRPGRLDGRVRPDGRGAGDGPGAGDDVRLPRAGGRQGDPRARRRGDHHGPERPTRGQVPHRLRGGLPRARHGQREAGGSHRRHQAHGDADLRRRGRGQPQATTSAMHRSDYQMRDILPAWRMLSSRVPVYDTWDDHDYSNNDMWGTRNGFTDADRRGIRAVFTKAWVNPPYGFGDAKGGVFLHTQIGPVDVIMVDNRYFRTGDMSQGSLLGREQLDWVKKQLLACKGQFIIMTCGTMWSDNISGGKDSWGHWDRKGREELFRFIEDNHIAGVLLCSGDRHGARVLTIPRAGGFKFYEFEPGSLGGMQAARPRGARTRPRSSSELRGSTRSASSASTRPRPTRR